MKLILATMSALIAMTTSVQAESIISELCGLNHENEVQMQSDIQANPDGYFIRDLKIQLSHGDPRIVVAVGDEFHLCTRSAATPDMSANTVEMMKADREVKFLFVPNCPKRNRPSS